MMPRFLVCVLILLCLGCADYEPIVRRKGIYATDVNTPLSLAQAHFERRFRHKFNRPFDDFVTIYFYDQQQDVNALCRSEVDVAGCIYSYWQFIILDHPNPTIRCQTILHEAGHMALVQITGDFDYEHKDPYFSEFVFEPSNCQNLTE